MSQSASPPLVAVLNGPNMNMLGLRQPELYGSATLDDVEQLCAETAEQLGLAIDFRQTNGEGELVSWVQECRGRAQGIVINPAGYTTTSIALMDALLATDLPVIEVHVTNIHRREEFRQHSLRLQGGGRRDLRPGRARLCAGADGHGGHPARGRRMMAVTSGHDDGGRADARKHMTRIPFDPDAIRALAAVLNETGLTEIEIAEKDSRIRVVRAPRRSPAPMRLPRPRRAIAPAVAQPPRAAPEATTPAIPARCSARWSASPICRPSPARRPSSPSARASTPGQTLLLIEAMKTFNQIKAPKAGTVARILVANSTPVEYGEVLLILE